MPRAVFDVLTIVPILAAALFLQACSGAYFNTTFNAEKAYRQAESLREKRFDRNPEDTVGVSTEERAKLNRAVIKGSKVLELWPNDPRYAPRAVFLIADSYLMMEEYDRAALKYEEFVQYFPKSEKVPLARIRRARALYLDGQSLNARDALEEILGGDPRGEVRREALLLSARMQVDENSPADGLALYEQLLAEGAFTSPETRNEAHWRAALIAFEMKEWEKARHHALAGDARDLPARARYRNRRLGILSLFGLGRFAEGVAEIRAMQRDKTFRSLRPELSLLRARGLEGLNDWPAAERLYRDIAKASPRGALAAEAWYRIAVRALEVENREDSARAWFDSSVAAGQGFEFGESAREKAAALARLAELRAPDTTGADSARPHYRGFMIAEVFLFRLLKPDSAGVHLNRIAADSLEDSAHTRRALYALAYLEETSYGNRARADSLYRAILGRYPGTEWAKQAEKNLGLPPTVRTEADKARELFLKAEGLRLAGADPAARVIPAYREVAALHPETPDAAQAMFVLAFLVEDLSRTLPDARAGLDSAKAAYEAVRDRYPGTPYAERASEKLAAAGQNSQAAESGGEPGDAGRDGGSRDGDEPHEDDGEEDAGKPYREHLDPNYEQDLY